MAVLEKVFYTSVLVSDQDEALDFYTNVLGLEKRVENPTPDGPRFLTVGVKGDESKSVVQTYVTLSDFAHGVSHATTKVRIACDILNLIHADLTVTLRETRTVRPRALRGTLKGCAVILLLLAQQVFAFS